MRERDHLIKGTIAIMRGARVLNWLFLAAVAVGLVATWLAPGFFERLLIDADPATNVSAALLGVRLLMLVGVVMALATERLLISLTAVVSSANKADPFVPANAQRLRTIGWALLALQLLDLPCTALARFWPSLGSAAPVGGVSIGGWLATLMVFVFARVFATGSAMRDDLAGTV